MNPFPLHARMLTGLNVVPSHVCSHRCYEFMNAMLLSCTHFFFSTVVLPILWLLPLSAPSSMMIPEPWGRRVIYIDSPFVVEHPTGTYSLRSDQS